MAPYNKLSLLALFVAFAVVAPSLLPPSAAARDGGVTNAAAAAPAPSSEAPVHPMDLFDDVIHFDLPIPRILPCPPVFPKIPFIPCYNYTPSPAPPPPRPSVTECRLSLAKYMAPCSGILTDGSSVPFNRSSSAKCCGIIQHFFDDKTTTPFCLCHLLNGGDADAVLHAPVNHTRALSFLHVCGYGLTPDTFPKFCDDSRVPPMDAASPPPPRRQGTKA